jgi:hypothetical protein
VQKAYREHGNADEKKPAADYTPHTRASGNMLARRPSTIGS